MRWNIAIVYGLLRLLGRLPLRWLHALGASLGWVLGCSNNAFRRKGLRTLARVNTSFGAPSADAFLRSALIEVGKSFTEVAKIWTSDPRRLLGYVREVRGAELLDAALAAKRGLIIAAPHLGSWELLNYWLGAHIPNFMIAYRPPRQTALEQLLRRARGHLAVEQVRAEGSRGVRRLFRRLADGGTVGLLPDQQPKRGDGSFAPFFGTPVPTMVLLSRLALRAHAIVLFAFAERLPKGAGYIVHILPAPPDIDAADPTTAAAALNCGVEACVHLAPTQYQWQYNRYT